jgi:hypothetical protein
MCPYVMFSQQGFHVDVVSMKGGKIPIDAGSLADAYVTSYVKTFMADGAQLLLSEHQDRETHAMRPRD